MNADIAATAATQIQAPPITPARRVADYGEAGGLGPTGSPVAAAHQASVQVDTFPTSPPPHLGDEIAVARVAAGLLASGGRHVHFGLDPATGHLKIEVRDLDGYPLGTIPPSKALELAGGGSLD
jgi:hypothetical protein